MSISAGIPSFSLPPRPQESGPELQGLTEEERVKAVTSYAVDVLGLAAGLDWMTSSIPSLSGGVPGELSKDSVTGAEQCRDALGRIRFGIYS